MSHLVQISTSGQDSFLQSPLFCKEQLISELVHHLHTQTDLQAGNTNSSTYMETYIDMIPAIFEFHTLALLLPSELTEKTSTSSCFKIFRNDGLSSCVSSQVFSFLKSKYLLFLQTFLE